MLANNNLIKESLFNDGYYVQYAKDNKIKLNQYHAEYNRFIRRPKRRAIIHSFTAQEWRQKYKNCALCGRIEKLTLDHIFPISKAQKGHIYGLNDVQALCHPCNSRKGNKVISYAR